MTQAIEHVSISDRIPRVVLTALGMVPSTGGTVQSVKNFRRALCAEVISFTDEDQLQREGTAIEGAFHIPCARDLLGRHYSKPRRAAIWPAASMIEQAELFSCHVLFRYHTHCVASWARRRQRPYWVVVHGCLDPYVFTYRALPKRLWMMFWGRRFLAGAAKVIFSTEQEREKAHVHYSGTNTCVVNWPVNPIVDEGAGPKRAHIRAELGIAPHAPVLLFLGRLHPMKRPDLVLRAWAEGGRRGHLVLAGPEEGVTHASLRMLAGRLGVQNLHLTGAVYGERKIALLHACDGFISLSQRENFGYSVAEALSAGKPVILSPGNDLARDLAPHHCGWLLDDDSSSAAATAIRQWAEAEPALREEMGARGRRYVATELSFTRFAERLQALARESLAAKG